MIGSRHQTPARRSTWCLFVAAAGLSAGWGFAQEAGGELRMVVVPSEHIRSMEQSQRVVTGLLRAAYEEVEAADELLGRTRDLDPVLEVLAGAGRMSNDLVPPSAETDDGLSVPLIAACGEDVETAWTSRAVRVAYSSESRLRRLVRLLESFSLSEAYGTVASALGELEVAEGISQEAVASLSRAKSRLSRALHVHETGVLGAFVQSVVEGAARVADPAVVGELCAQRELESPAVREDPSPGSREDSETPDLELARAARVGALKTIQSTLATLDNFVCRGIPAR